MVAYSSPRRMTLCAALFGYASGMVNTVNRAGFLEVEPPDAFASLERRRLDDTPNPYTCAEGVESAKEEWKAFGTNLGGWLVLEPWITPSLFYQFLSLDQQYGTDTPLHTGMDQFTFCQALGPSEGNKQLRRHWRTWVREEDIRAIADSGANVVRIPVGDWMYVPYGPYVGCTDGSLEELERVLALLRKYGLRALLDVHAMSGSQNGFDNSGEARKVKWTQVSSQDPQAVTTFEHWPLRAADWLGQFNTESFSYGDFNETAYAHSIKVVSLLADRHAADPTVWGVEPVNEPWQFIPIEWIKRFYWDGYNVVRAKAPAWKYVMHDSFRGYPAAWWDFMKGCPNKVMDAHIYQAWNRPAVAQTFFDNACKMDGGIKTMEEQVDMPIIVGEWSLATDNCAMWLNGFNDNLPGFPKVSCVMVDCPPPYMGSEQPGCPPDPEEPLQGPYGTGVSGPMFGKCPKGMPWGTQEDGIMRILAHKYCRSFSVGHGHFMWNFRTEIEDRWSYLQAWRNGWLPKNVSDYQQAPIAKACDEPGTSDGKNKVDTGDVSAPREPNALFRQVFDARAFTPLPFSGGPIEAPARAFPTAVVALLLLTVGATVALRAAPGIARALKGAFAAPRDGRPQALPLEEEARGGVAAYVPLQ